MKKNTKKDLEDKIKELEKRLGVSDDQLHGNDEDWMKPDKNHAHFEDDDAPEIGEDIFDTIKEIAKAKKQVIPRAGSVQTTEDGNVLSEDNVEPIRIPKQSIHEFTNLEKCECECHGKGKVDCMYCYDHKQHLDAKRKKVPDVTDEYDESKILELIKADKIKKEKKHWWK